MAQEITAATPIAMCTVGQLVSFLQKSGVFPQALAVDAKTESSGSTATVEDPNAKIDHDGRKIRGLEGIMEEFGCSKSTAQKYKKGIFKDIVVQNGHKIFLDASKAWRCYENYKGKGRRKASPSPANT